MSLEQIKEEATQLRAHEQRELLAFLVSIQKGGDDAVAPSNAGVEAAWNREIGERIRAIDEGREVGVAYEDVLRETTKRAGA